MIPWDFGFGMKQSRDCSWYVQNHVIHISCLERGDAIARAFQDGLREQRKFLHVTFLPGSWTYTSLTHHVLCWSSVQGIAKRVGSPALYEEGFGWREQHFTSKCIPRKTAFVNYVAVRVHVRRLMPLMCTYIYMYICMYICTRICMYLCMYIRMFECKHLHSFFQLCHSVARWLYMIYK